MDGNNKTRRRGIHYPGIATLLLLWTAVGSLAYGQHAILGHPFRARPQLLYEWLTWLTCFLPWAALSPIVFRLEQRYLLEGTQWLRNFARLFLAGLVLSYAGAQLTFILNVVLQALFRRPMDIPQGWWLPSLQELSIVFFIFACVVVASYLIRNVINLHQREQEAAELALQKSELERTLRQVELETLRARLNPHFLFNCLQNISVLTQEDPPTAGKMLTRLGDLLRTALRGSASQETTLESEIDLTKTYVAVEIMRFGDRLSVMFDIATQSQSALVPTFLLQPLVENAILHGLREISREGIILVRSAIEKNNLLLTVTDNGKGLSVKNVADLETGIGLGATRERLERMYPGQHTFSIRTLPEGGTEVLLALPLRFENVESGVASNEQASLVDRR